MKPRHDRKLLLLGLISAVAPLVVAFGLLVAFVPSQSALLNLPLLVLVFGLALGVALLLFAWLAGRLEAASQRAQQLAALRQADQALKHASDLETIYAATYQAAAQLVPVDAFAVALIDRASDQVEAAFLMDRGQRRPALRFPIEVGLAGYLLRSGQPVLFQSSSEWPAGVVRFGEAAGVQSVLAVPMRLQDEVLGVLAAESYRPRAYRPEAVPLLAALADHAAMALQRAREPRQAYAEAPARDKADLPTTPPRLDQVRLVTEVSRDLASNLDVESVTTQVCRRLEEDFGYYRARLGLIEGGAVVFQARDDERRSRHQPQLHVPLDGPDVIAEVARSGQPRYVPDVGPASVDGSAGRPAEIRSEAVVPLLARGRIIGVVYIQSDRVGDFGPADAATLEAVAGLVAVALDNARLLAEARQRAAEVSALLSTTTAVSSSLDLAERLRAVAQRAQALVEADACTIYRRDPEGRFLLPLVALDEHYAQQILDDVVPVGEGIVGSVAQSGVGELVNRADLDPRARHIPGTPLTPENLMVIPLAVGTHLIGVMAVYREGLREFTPHHFDLLSSFAAQAAVAIENAELYQALRERADSLQATYDELAEMDRLKDEMVQNISHELRTPLTFLKSYLDLLLSGEMGPLLPEQEHSLRVVQAKTESLVRLVSDMITLQAVTPSSIRRVPLDLSQLARSAADGVTAVARQADVEVRMAVPDERVEVCGDALRLTQVLDNLLGNAVKFTPRGGHIELKVLPETDWVRVEVRDTGVGISPEFLERIFERFYQIDGSSTRRRGGLGLGLAICKLIVEVHGGHIGVESQVGVGSCFYFVLPRSGST